MQEKRSLGIFIVLIISIIWTVSGQGCSDAGFCTMGAMKPDQDYNKRLNLQLRTVEINLYHGQTTLSPTVNVATIDFTLSLNTRNFVQVKVPYQYVEGNLAQTHGIGDLSLGYTRALGQALQGDWNFTLGTKLPTGRANRSDPEQNFGTDGDLPMYYQTSLGSFDFIAGLAYLNRKWLIATGIQLPVAHINQNEFKWSDWSEYPSQSYIESHDRATHLKRGTDIMLRVERNFRWTKFNFNFGVLSIYRITKDQIKEDPLGGGNYMKLEGTTGLALSLLGGAGYNFDTKNAIKLILGKKWFLRDVNPDGLTRDHVVSVSYVHKF